MKLNLLSPISKVFGYDTLFGEVEKQSFTNNVDLYMSQILPSCLDKIDFERNGVGDHRLHIFRLKKEKLIINISPKDETQIVVSLKFILHYIA